MSKLLLSLGLLFTSFLHAQDKLIISDPMAVIRDMGKFEKIEIHGPFKVYYSVSDKCTVAISAHSESARDRIRVKNNGGVLTIDLENSYRNWISVDGKHQRLKLKMQTSGYLEHPIPPLLSRINCMQLLLVPAIFNTLGILQPLKSAHPEQAK